jgi:predicted amidohydrolase YtcJ
VDLATAIRAYTLGSAWAVGVDDDRGSIAPGKAADLAILSHDLSALDDPRALLDVRTERTIVGGEVVFER